MMGYTGWQFFAVIGYVASGGGFVWGVRRGMWLGPQTWLDWIGFLLVILLWPFFVVFFILALIGQAAGRFITKR